MAMCLILDAMEARALVAFQEYIPKFPLGPAELAREPRVDVVQPELGRGRGALAEMAIRLGEATMGSVLLTHSTGAPDFFAWSISLAYTSASGKSPATSRLKSSVWPRRKVGCCSASARMK